MSITLTPYKQLFVCSSTERDEDGDCIHDDLCTWTWQCNGCGRDVSGKPCPEHAPAEVPGLQMIRCEAGHGPTWVVDDDGYEPSCPWCVIADEVKAHEGCEHAAHGRWRRWKVVHRALSRLYALGVVSGHGTVYGRGCHGCATGISFGRNGYLLGWPRWKWQCVLTARHWPGEEVTRKMCGKCNPCPSCGSQRVRHERTCEWA